MQAQEALSGAVSCKNKPIPGVTVVVRVAGQEMTAATDEQGAFKLAGVPAGKVDISLQMFGFAPFQKTLEEAERQAPVKLELTLRSGPVRAQEQTEGESVEAQVNQMAEQAPPPLADPAETSDSLIVQGSISRSLDPNMVVQDPLRGLEGMFGPGGMMQGGAMPPGMNPEAIASALGMGGGPAGGPMMGGPGGRGGGDMMGGGRDMRGGRTAPSAKGAKGDRSDRGGPGGLFASLAKMSPEAREKAIKDLRNRAGNRGPGGQAQMIGNRSRRLRDQIRGSVYLMARSDALDASPYSLNGQSIVKPSYSTYRYGGTFGGPVRIPGTGETPTVLMFNYSGTHSTNPVSNFYIVPSLLERAGDFSQSKKLPTIFDPGAGAPFPGNRIPESRFDPIATKLMAYIPTPNQTGALQNYRLLATNPANSGNYQLTVSRSILQKNRFTFGMSWQTRDGFNLQPYGFRDISDGSGRNFDLRYNRPLSTRVILNLRARYNLNRNETTPFFANGKDISAELGITGNSRTPANYGPPNLNFTNFADLTDAAYLRRSVHTWTYGASVVAVKGKYTTTAGIEMTRSQWNTQTESNARGTLTLGGLATSQKVNGSPAPNTGFDFADFLLGLPQAASLRLGAADTYLRQTVSNAYVQEAMRLSSRFTLTLGVRYEIWNPFIEKYGRMANLDISPGWNSVAVVTPGQAGPFSGPFPRGLVRTDWNNISPRVGLAWRPLKMMRVRSGYGMYDDGSVWSRMPTRLTAQPPFALTSSFSTSTNNVLTLSNPFTGPKNVNVKNTYAVARNFLTPYAQTWNFNIELDLPGHYVAEFGYVGTKGTRLVMQRSPNRAAPGSVLTAEQRRQIGNASGFSYDSTEGNSIFHAGTVRLNRRYRRGLSWNVNYTLGRTIDNATAIGGAGGTIVQNDKDFAAERGLSAFDVRHNFSAGGMVQSPFGRNGFYLRNGGRTGRFLENWNLTASFTVRTGTPLTARVSGTSADSSGTGAAGSSRAQATGLPVQVDGSYFNTAAFALPPPGTYGNAGRNTVPGPGAYTLNAGFGRSFQVGDNARRRLSLRIETANTLNHANISGYGTVVNAIDYGLATRASSMRTVNLTARYNF